MRRGRFAKSTKALGKAAPPIHWGQGERCKQLDCHDRERFKGPTNVREDYRSPRQYAGEKGNLPIVKLLIENYIADDSPSGLRGYIPRTLAYNNCHHKVVKYLDARRRDGARKRDRFCRWMAEPWHAMRGMIGTIVVFHACFKGELCFLKFPVLCLDDTEAQGRRAKEV
jgi:hypothetical protein